MLRDLAARRLDYAQRDGEAFFDAVQNARLIADAERYYRAMYYGSNESWNLRDRHMFETLEALLAFHGAGSKAVVWEHNSHLGDASATEMGLRGQLNVGQLCREKFGDAAFLIGFGTDHGTVAAADDWDGPMRVMQVRPAHRRELRAPLPRRGRAGVLPAPARAGSRGAARRARAPAPRARDRRRVPARHRAPEPLLPRQPAAAVRRVRLDRRDARRAPGDGGRRARAGAVASRSRRESGDWPASAPGPDARSTRRGRADAAASPSGRDSAPTRPPRRYLWTDAFASLQLPGAVARDGSSALPDARAGAGRPGARRARPPSRRRRAPRLDQRPRRGAKARCIRRGGGLRIGKPLPERPRGAPSRRAARVGARRPVLPLPDALDARPRPARARDAARRASTPGRASSPRSRTARSPPARARAGWRGR